MKNLLLTLAILIGIGVSFSMIGAEKTEKGKLLHVVSFKFKDTAGADKVKEVEEAFRGLKKKIPQITSLEWGTNVSPEKHDKGFTHGFILGFKSDKDRDDY